MIINSNFDSIFLRGEGVGSDGRGCLTSFKRALTEGKFRALLYGVGTFTETLRSTLMSRNDESKTI